MIDHFHLTLQQIANLTDWQIYSLYFHPRDKYGAIEEEDDIVIVDQPVPTFNGQMLEIDILGSQFKLSSAKVAELKDKVRAKWAANNVDTEELLTSRKHG